MDGGGGWVVVAFCFRVQTYVSMVCRFVPDDYERQMFKMRIKGATAASAVSAS